MTNFDQKHDKELMRRENKRLIFSVIRKNSPVSRSDISRLTGMSPAAVGRIVCEMISEGIIKEFECDSNKVGRKPLMLKISTENYLSVGLEIDRGYIIGALVDFKGKVIKKVSKEYNFEKQLPEFIVSLAVSIVSELLENGEYSLEKIVGIGISLPGLVDTHHGKVVFSPQLSWRNVEFVKLFKNELSMPLNVIIDNDIKVCAVAESLFGYAQNSETCVVVTIGSGVGASVIINQSIYRGNSNMAGEIGHTIVDPNGLLCECGRLGCLQTYIADWALVEQAKKFQPNADLSGLMLAYKSGEQWAINIINRAVNYTGMAIANLVCLYNPDIIILRGHLIFKNSNLVSLIKEKYEEYLWTPFIGTCKILISEFGENEVVIGSGALAFYLGLDEYL